MLNHYKKIICSFIVVISMIKINYGATRNVVPRANDEGYIGTAAKNWNMVYASSITIGSTATVNGTFIVPGGSMTIKGVTQVWGPNSPNNGNVPKYNSTNRLIEWNNDNDTTDNFGSHVATKTATFSFSFNASSAVFTSSVAAWGGFTSTEGFTGGNSTFSAIVTSSLTFLGTSDGKIRTQKNVGFELLASTVIDSAISTMTVTFSSSTFLYIVIYGSANASPGGEMMVRFNNNDSSNYKLNRTTFSINANPGLRGGIATSSTNAVGLPLFGVNESTSMLRMAEIKLFGNETSQPKLGEYSGVAVSSGTFTDITTNGTFSWRVENTINTISAFLTYAGGATHRPYSGPLVWRAGSKIHVYGRND